MSTRRYSDCLPKLVLCVVGGEDFRPAATPLLEASGLEFEWRGPNGRMAAAFAASACRVIPTLGEDDYEQIRRHRSVLYVLSENYPAGQAARVAHTMLRLGCGLLKAGGAALKCDSSGIAHAAARWCELASRADSGLSQVNAARDDADKLDGLVGFWAALYQSFVRFPLAGGGDLHSCGLHLLGRPDVVIADDLARVAYGDDPDERALAAAKLAGNFSVYLLAECPDGGVEPGHTFRESAGSPRFLVTREPCTGYDEDDFLFNPYGRWRFAEVVGDGPPSPPGAR